MHQTDKYIVGRLNKDLARRMVLRLVQYLKLCSKRYKVDYNIIYSGSGASVVNLMAETTLEYGQDIFS